MRPQNVFFFFSENAGAIRAMGKKKEWHASPLPQSPAQSERERGREREREREREQEQKRERERERKRKREQKKRKKQKKERKRERERDGGEPPRVGIPKIRKQTLRKNIFRELFFLRNYENNLYENKLSEKYSHKITHLARNSWQKITQNNFQGIIFVIISCQSVGAIGTAIPCSAIGGGGRAVGPLSSHRRSGKGSRIQHRGPPASDSLARAARKGVENSAPGKYPVLLFLGFFENTKENLKNTKDFLTLRTLKNPVK